MDPMELRKLTVEGFINETASSSPAPGGGSIAALNAASSAALITMVANLTLGKEKYAAVEGDMKEVAAKAGALKDDFLALIDEDSNAFNKIMAAFKLPKDTDEAKKARSAAIQDATKGAALVPFKVGQKANELFALAEEVITKGNQNAITDGAVAAMNARAAVRGAFLNVKINLGSIKDGLFVEDLQKKMAEIENEVDAREKALLGKVKL
jgi:formiminotetrahydrofolate cyclodeaminase